MPTQRSSFDKLQRERLKKERAAAKRERRAERSAASASGETSGPAEPKLTPEGELSPAELMRRVEDLHTRYANGEMELEEFEEAKAELMALLTVD